MNRLILVLTVLISAAAIPSAAHDGHDHSGESLMPDAPTPLGAPVHMPKATQFLMEVRTAPVVEETLPNRLQTLGRVVFPQSQQAQVRSPYSGIIVIGADIPVPEPGMQVEEGTVLALLEQSIEAPQRITLSADIVEVESELALATEHKHHTDIELERVKSLGEAASERRLVEAQAANDHARLQIEGLKRKRDQLKRIQSVTSTNPQLVPLLAPITGVVVVADVTPGEFVGPERLLFEIVDPSTVWTVAEVYEKDLPLVADALRATVTGEGYDDVYEASIHHVSPRLHPETRTVHAVFEVANPEGKLRDGMFVDINIATEEQVTGIMTPRESIVEQNGVNVAYVKTGAEMFIAREVRIAGAWGDRYMVTEGLLPNDIVVTQGVYQVRATAAMAETSKPLEETVNEHGHEH